MEAVLTGLTVRRLQADDADRMAGLYARMSPLSRYRRYLSVAPALPADRLRALVNVDEYRHIGFVAVHGDDIVAVARYVRLRSQPDRAEVAVEVADEWQRQGVGRSLLLALTEHARGNGIEAFTATMSRENVPILRLLRSIASGIQFSYEGPLAEAVIPLDGVRVAADRSVPERRVA